jgi:hypothetical protein
MQYVDDVLLGLSYIRRALKRYPHQRYVTPDNKLLLVLLPDDRVLSIPGDFYKDATEESITEYIQLVLEQL